jgi:hypothetical protein
MSLMRVSFILVVVCVQMYWMLDAQAEEMPTVKELFSVSKGGHFKEPAPAETDRAEELFLRALRGDRSPGLAEAWKRLGFRMMNATQDGKNYLVLVEQEDLKIGRGFFVFSQAPGPSIGLFMPHRFSDEHTGPIGLSLTLEGSFPVSAWNTLPRRSKGLEKNLVWDLAKLQPTYFSALTKAFARAFPEGFHIQIHGFETTKRRTESGENSDGIISGGDSNPRREIFGLRECIEEKGLGRFRVYPSETRELGATKNVSGKILREMNNRGFVHIEMNLDLRERLKNDKDLRRSLLECLSRQLRSHTSHEAR